MFGNIKGWLARHAAAFLHLVYPESCRACGAPVPLETREAGGARNPLHPFFCRDCWRTVRPLEGPFCPVCSAPFSSDAALSRSPAHRCGDCRADPPPFSLAVTPYLYEGALAEAIQMLKYRNQPAIARRLADLLADALRGIACDLVMAVPLHPSRLREREFNQSLLIAKGVSRRLRRPLSIDDLRRRMATAPQVGLSRRAREKNVKGAFEVIRPEAVTGRRILLVDDVYTTGATLKACAKALARGGAGEVIAAAPARMRRGGAPTMPATSKTEAG